jgi:hypothetical protein
MSTSAVPVAQVVDGIASPWEDPIIWRWDRRRAISVQCSPNGVTAPTLRNAVLASSRRSNCRPATGWTGTASTGAPSSPKVPREKVELPKRSNKGKYDDQATLEGRKFVPEKY